MSEELKYCKFCGKEKPVKDFCKSGSFIKNICRDCQNKKQKQIYQNSKKVEQLENQLQQKENIIKEVREYIENNWISQKDADNYRFDDEELNIEISDIAVLFDILDKEKK